MNDTAVPAGAPSSGAAGDPAGQATTGPNGQISGSPHSPEHAPDLPRSASARLAKLASRYGLGGRQRDQLATLLAALGGDPTAPTSVREPERAVDVHVADSLSALAIERVPRARRAADIGSGAGLPGLPLAIALPQTRFSLVESSKRKCRFLRGVVDAAGVGNAEPVCCRVEQWLEGHGAHDLVVARAVAPPAVVAEYAAPLLKVGGLLVDWRGAVGAEEEAQALAAAAILGLRREEIVLTSPFPEATQHFLHLYLKVRDTPHRFPRRPGMARKRPLPA